MRVSSAPGLGFLGNRHQAPEGLPDMRGLLLQLWDGREAVTGEAASELGRI